MDVKRFPVRHVTILVLLVAGAILTYLYTVNESSTPTKYTPALSHTAIVRHVQDIRKEELPGMADIGKTESRLDEPTFLSDHIDPKPSSDSKFKSSRVAKTQQGRKHSRPDRCFRCFQPQTTTLLAAKYTCRPTEIAGNVDIITVIFSQPNNRARRDVIRQTWASPTKENTAILRHLFVIGYSQNPDENYAIELEYKEHFDLIQLDTLDTYGNLTLKALAALQWVSKYCSGAKYVLKVDDDIWLNLQRLLWVLPRYDLNKAVGGFCIKNARPNRDPQSKWYASISAYPRSLYPPFCSGTGYIMEVQTMKDILRESVNVPFFHLEDVYITGLCMEKLGYQIQSLPGFHNEFVHFNACVYRRTVITSHNVDDELLQRAWISKCDLHPYVLNNTS